MLAIARFVHALPPALPVTALAAAVVVGFGAGHGGHGAPAGPHDGVGEIAPVLPAHAQQSLDRLHEFYFTRGAYSSGRMGFRGRSWSTDFPKADRQFTVVIGETLQLLDVYPEEHPVRLDDPELRRFPFLYILEVGYMALTAEEVRGLREYLEAGGFLVVDDFWGTREWRTFEREMRRVLPDREIEEIPLDHPIFRVFYEIDEIKQVPSIGNARRGGSTHERDGYVPHVRGIFDDDGRLMAVVNWNTDLGDAWEWSERPEYPFEYSSFAYKMAANFIVYAMTH